jgi:hypothetical protein
MLSRRVISAARVARPLPRPLFIRAFSEQKESPTQPFNHSEEKMKVDEAETSRADIQGIFTMGANVFTTGLKCVLVGLPAAIYIGNQLTPSTSATYFRRLNLR